jgi:hypothetical protein
MIVIDVPADLTGLAEGSWHSVSPAGPLRVKERDVVVAGDHAGWSWALVSEVSTEAVGFWLISESLAAKLANLVTGELLPSPGAHEGVRR